MCRSFYHYRSKLGEQVLPWDDGVVLKPIDSASSENVKVFPCVASLQEALQARNTGIELLDREDANLERFEVEQFIPGSILHFDGLVHKGRVVVFASQYVGTCLRFANSEPLGSVEIDIDDETKAWVSQVLTAVELTRGCFHLEAINSKSGLTFWRLPIELAVLM